MAGGIIPESRAASPGIGIYTTIDPPGSHSTEPTGINASGDIVGVYKDVSGVDHGFLWIDGAYTVLDFPRAADTYPLAINRGGQVVGGFLEHLTKRLNR